MGAGREVLRSFGELMHGRVEPVYAEDVLQAGMLANDYPGVSARDLVHWDWAVMQRAGAERIITADTDCNCSDLRGSAGYSASCEGATKYRISTANRFRPLKREQLRACANHQERVT